MKITFSVENMVLAGLRIRVRVPSITYSRPRLLPFHLCVGCVPPWKSDGAIILLYYVDNGGENVQL
jgi:hypothetical protein